MVRCNRDLAFPNSKPLHTLMAKLSNRRGLQLRTQDLAGANPHNSLPSLRRQHPLRARLTFSSASRNTSGPKHTRPLQIARFECLTWVPSFSTLGGWSWKVFRLKELEKSEFWAVLRIFTLGDRSLVGETGPPWQCDRSPTGETSSRSLPTSRHSRDGHRDTYSLCGIGRRSGLPWERLIPRVGILTTTGPLGSARTTYEWVSGTDSFRAAFGTGGGTGSRQGSRVAS
uniref:Uncharacterized protein n=1 Tax=Ananas comosus var. bracteatus TaxID=296719 RepID=A0A6V7P1Y7_ANACO|nr:unnamed protein product [Ananas comosus var. bracteatus]